MQAKAALALAVLLFAAGWQVQGWRKDAEIAAANARHATELKAISDKAIADEESHRQREAGWRDQLAELDQRRTQEIADAKIENERLRAAVDTAAMQLRVRAVCPAGRGDVPGAAGAAGMDDAGTVELDPAARSSYFALRQSIIDNEGKLMALQDYVRAILARPDSGALQLVPPE